MLMEDVHCFAEKILQWYKLSVSARNNNWICRHLVMLVFWNTKHSARSTYSNSNIPVQMQHAEGFCKFPCFPWVCGIMHSKMALPFKEEPCLCSAGSREQHVTYFHALWQQTGIHECAFGVETVEFGLQENKRLPHRCYWSIWQDFWAFKCVVLLMCAHQGLKRRGFEVWTKITIL